MMMRLAIHDTEAEIIASPRSLHIVDNAVKGLRRRFRGGRCHPTAIDIGFSLIAGAEAR